MTQTKKDARSRGKTAMIRARIDPDLKVKAETILGNLGLNASDAIRLFYTQIMLSDGLPFDVRIPNRNPQGHP
jgi:DNA-damage-inducible protein J